MTDTHVDRWSHNYWLNAVPKEQTPGDNESSQENGLYFYPWLPISYNDGIFGDGPKTFLVGESPNEDGMRTSEPTGSQNI
jgi:hypothetical protein